MSAREITSADLAANVGYKPGTWTTVGDSALNLQPQLQSIDYGLSTRPEAGADIGSLQLYLNAEVPGKLDDIRNFQKTIGGMPTTADTPILLGNNGFWIMKPGDAWGIDPVTPYLWIPTTPDYKTVNAKSWRDLFTVTNKDHWDEEPLNKFGITTPLNRRMPESWTKNTFTLGSAMSDLLGVWGPGIAMIAAPYLAPLFAGLGMAAPIAAGATVGAATGAASSAAGGKDIGEGAGMGAAGGAISGAAQVAAGGLVNAGVNPALAGAVSNAAGNAAAQAATTGDVNPINVATAGAQGGIQGYYNTPPGDNQLTYQAGQDLGQYGGGLDLNGEELSLTGGDSGLRVDSDINPDFTPTYDVPKFYSTLPEQYTLLDNNITAADPTPGDTKTSVSGERLLSGLVNTAGTLANSLLKNRGGNNALAPTTPSPTAPNKHISTIDTDALTGEFNTSEETVSSRLNQLYNIPNLTGLIHQRA